MINAKQEGGGKQIHQHEEQPTLPHQGETTMLWQKRMQRVTGGSDLQSLARGGPCHKIAQKQVTQQELPNAKDIARPRAIQRCPRKKQVKARTDAHEVSTTVAVSAFSTRTKAQRSPLRTDHRRLHQSTKHHSAKKSWKRSNHVTLPIWQSGQR